MKAIVCPISTEKISEHLPRVNAFVIITLIGFYLFTQSIIWPIIIAVDFLLRGFNYHKYSPTYHVAIAISNGLKLESTRIDKAPKIFAARLGGIMFIGIFLLHLAGFTFASSGISILVATLAFLECAAGICVGCYVYTYLVNPLFDKK